MGLETDPNAPCLRETRPDGQQECYLVLSDEERAKGFVRPVRQSYVHIGAQSKYDLRPLTEEEKVRHAGCNYVAFEKYPESESPVTGRFWTQEQLDARQCGAITRMPLAIAETYARDPKFYGATYCVKCQKHLPVEEFVWIDQNGNRTSEVLGS